MSSIVSVYERTVKITHCTCILLHPPQYCQHKSQENIINCLQEYYRINASSASTAFTDAFLSSFTSFIESPSFKAGPDELVTVFNSECSDIWDVIARIKTS